MNTRLYHVDWENLKTKATGRMTGYPMPHKECMTFISKQTNYPWRRVYVVSLKEVA